jgi:hypothetical protein
LGPQRDEGIDSGSDVERLGPAIAVLTFGFTHTAKVEAQHADTSEREESEELTCHE